MNRHPPGFWNRLFGRSDIYFNDSCYMHRWRVINLPWFGVRLHHILRSDSDRELHDHPFSFLSFILTGGYWEHRPRIASTVAIIRPNGARDDILTKRTWYGSGSFIFRRAEDLHRLELKMEYDGGNNVGPPGYIPPKVPRTAWTLVFRGPVRRRWGFQTADGWVDAKARKTA